MSDNPKMARMIEQSSLGTRHAKQMRARVSAATGRNIVRAAADRTRAANTVNNSEKKKAK